jgi:hypothetical protein
VSNHVDDQRVHCARAHVDREAVVSAGGVVARDCLGQPLLALERTIQGQANWHRSYARTGDCVRPRLLAPPLVCMQSALDSMIVLTAVPLVRCAVLSSGEARRMKCERTSGESRGRLKTRSTSRTETKSE